MLPRAAAERVKVQAFLPRVPEPEELVNPFPRHPVGARDRKQPGTPSFLVDYILSVSEHFNTSKCCEAHCGLSAHEKRWSATFPIVQRSEWLSWLRSLIYRSISFHRASYILQMPTGRVPVQEPSFASGKC